MINLSENLLETLVDLEQSRQREHEIRIESELLLEGLKNIIEIHGREELFFSLIELWHKAIDFQNAVFFQAQNDGRMYPLFSTTEKMYGTLWTPHSLFQRVIEGEPVAVFDVEQVPEWREQPPPIRDNIKSALHIGLKGFQGPAILIVTHLDTGHFGTPDIRRANRLRPLVSQMLQTIGLRRQIVQRNRFFELSLELMAILDSSGHFKQINPAWEHILGYPEKQLREYTLFDLLHEDDLTYAHKSMEQVKKTPGRFLVDLWFRCRDGSYKCLSCSMAVYPHETLCYLTARDITIRVKAEKQMEHKAHHDSLTGVYNRRMFLDLLRLSFAGFDRRPEKCFAVLYLDMDDFKTINDRLGHNIGDALLKEVAERLVRSVRANDIIARYGGDEFVVLLSDIDNPDSATFIVKRILREIDRPFVLQGHEIKTSVSIGIALNRTWHKVPEQIIREADMAMYKAKRNKKIRYSVYRPEE